MEAITARARSIVTALMNAIDWARWPAATVFDSSSVSNVVGLPDLDVVVKFPRKGGENVFDLEVQAIQDAPFARDFGFVEATVVGAPQTLASRISRVNGLSCKAGSTIVTMPWVHGTSALDPAVRKHSGANIIVGAIVDMLAKLKARKWLHTDIKLENIMMDDNRRIVFLDWGSLCRIDCREPTATYKVVDHTENAAVCASVNAVVCIGELLHRDTPADSVLTVDEYSSRRARVLETMNEPLRQRFANITACL